MASGMVGQGNADLLTIAGAMTIQRAAEIKGLLADALARSDRLAIDLDGVTEVDLSGLQLLCSAQRTASQSRKHVAFAGPTPEIFRRAAADAGVCVRSGCGAEDPGKCPWKGETER